MGNFLLHTITPNLLNPEKISPLVFVYLLSKNP